MESLTAAKDKVVSFSKDWWNVVTSNKRPAPDPAKMVTVSELPMYSEDAPKTYYFVEDPPLPLQEHISVVRRAVVDQYHALSARFEVADRAVKKTAAAGMKLGEHLREEWTVVPKAFAITVGGLAGYVFGMKRSPFRRIVYSATGLLTMAAFCYPEETIALLRTGVAHTKTAWSDFQASPEPPTSKKSESSA